MFHRNEENMTVNNEVRQRRGNYVKELGEPGGGAIKKAYILQILYRADVTLIIILGSKRYKYRSDNITIWLSASQVVYLSQHPTFYSIYIQY